MLDQVFQTMVSKGENENLEDFENNYEMYFNKSDQILKQFEDMEYRNLKLIEQTQEHEQAYDELNSNYQKTKKSQDTKIEA